MVNDYILNYSELSKEELQAKLNECNMKLFSMAKIDNIEELEDEIEALEFLLEKFESNE